MFNTIKNTNTSSKKRVNLTIEQNIYRQFSEKTKENLQPMSWVIEKMMTTYINQTK